MHETIKEGSAIIRIKKAKKISKEMEVFYNPIMNLNRDIAILLLQQLPPMHLCDPLAASGVRSIRFAKELKYKSIAINDINKKAVKSIKNNLKFNKLNNKKKLKIYNDDANLFLLNSKGFDYIAIDKLFYCDFYAIERFGKTRLGTLLHFAKQGQNRPLMQEIIELTKSRVENLVKEVKAEAVGYIPPTIKRHLQIMKVLQQGYNLPLPHINLLKVTGAIPVPQKSLSKLEDRISNAKASIVVKDTRRFGNILLIDDAVGSGATINETAVKLKQKGLAKKISGLAITGSFKGFDVIQEV